MKVFFVCSGNYSGRKFNFEINQCFIHEQMVQLSHLGIKVDLFLIRGRGLFGYLKNLHSLKSKLYIGDYDIVHAHSGLSGLVAILQRQVPVIVTYHGSDINNKTNNIISSAVSIFSKWRIFVSTRLYKNIYVKSRRHFSIIPCGVDLRIFSLLDKSKAREIMGLNTKRKYVLFSSALDRPVKNYDLARKAVDELNQLTLFEMKGYNRQEVNYLLNACDVLLLTSHSEGSPQIIKEAMACNCPIVSTDVGDVKEIIGDTEGCYITSFKAKDVAQKIQAALEFGKRTNGRGNIKHFEINHIAKRIIKVYEQIILENKRE